MSEHAPFRFHRNTDKHAPELYAHGYIEPHDYDTDPRSTTFWIFAHGVTEERAREILEARGIELDGYRPAQACSYSPTGTWNTYTVEFRETVTGRIIAGQYGALDI